MPLPEKKSFFSFRCRFGRPSCPICELAMSSPILPCKNPGYAQYGFVLGPWSQSV
jgi:hypothetical protein